MSKIGLWLSPPQGLSFVRPNWFYRRPLFWWAVAALVCIHWAYASPLPPWCWSLVTALGALTCLAFSREWGALLAVGGLFGALAAVEKQPGSLPHVREGAAVTLRGVILRAERSGTLLLEAEERLTLSGWAAERMRLGVRARPAGFTPGTRLEVSGRLRRPLPPTNPGGFDDRLRWLRRGAHWVLEPRPEGIRRVEQRPPPWWQRFSAPLRQAVLDRNRETLSPTGALIANSFLLGEEEAPDAELSDQVSAAFRESGTIHLLVVSGTQVSLVMGLFIWLGWRAWRLRFLFWGLGAVAVGVFWLLTDGGASVSRAALMGGVVVLGLSLDREPDGENCLGLAALVLMTCSRFAVFDIGAQLSFAAVWALLRLGPPLYRLLGPGELIPGVSGDLRPLHAGLAAVAAASVAAHLGTAPVLAYHFQRVSWSGLLANLPMSGLAGLFTYAALGHAVLPLPGGAALVDYGAHSFTGWAGFFAQPPFGARDVFPFPAWLFPLYFGALAAPALFRRSRWAVLGPVLALAGMLLLSERLPIPPGGEPTLRAFDVGQGDAILLESPAGTRVLVDAGPPPPSGRVPDLVRALRALRIPSLDALVVTHADSDHAGGVTPLLERVPVQLLIHQVEPEPAEEAAWDRVLAAARRLEIPALNPRAGDRLRLGDSELVVLAPAGAAAGNEGSLVFRWDTGGARVLLTGDAGHPSEAEQLAWGPELQADVLKVGHHGSAGSSGLDYLHAVGAPLAVVSCGRDNAYGHPAPEVLERLQGAGVTVARTDLGGMITVRTRGGRSTVEKFLHHRQ